MTTPTANKTEHTTPSRSRSWIGRAILGLALVGATQISAENARGDTAIAGDLNVLAQSTGASVCMIAAGIDITQEKQRLAATRTAFFTALSAVESYDTTDAIYTQWRPVDTATSMILVGDYVRGHADTTRQSQPGLVAATAALSHEISGDHMTSYGIVLTGGMTVDLIDRQTLFLQKIRLDVCQINAGYAGQSQMENLKQLIDIYDKTLVMLHDGQPSVGIERPTDAAIVDVLAQSMRDWAEVEPLLAAIAWDGAASPQELVHVSDALLRLESGMQTLTAQYLNVDDATPDRAIFVTASNVK